MSYAAQDASADDGSPVTLYSFARAGESTLRYVATNDRRATVFNVGGQNWTPSAVQSGAIESSLNLEASTVTITFPFSSAPNLRDEWTVGIYEVHRTDGALEAVRIWTGYTVGRRLRWQSGGGFRVEYRAMSLRSVGERTGQTNKCERSCAHMIYDERCGLDIADFQITATVTAINGDAVSVTIGQSPEPVASYFRFGVLDFDGVEADIRTHSVSGSPPEHVLQLQEVPDGLAVSSEVLLAPGCSGRPSLCNALGNILNFLGAHELPDKNIFGGGDRV